MTLKLNGSSSGYTAIDAPASAGSNTLVLPTSNGSANQVLKTDGSGILAWVAQTAAAANTPAFQVHKGGDSGSHQNISNATNTKVTWSHENLDTGSCFASDKFTPNVAGWYWFSCSLLMNFGEAEDEYGVIMLYKNGSSIFEARRVEGTGTMSQTLMFQYMAEANGSSDYFEIYTYQNSGGTREADKNDQCTWWNGFKLIGLS